ncbi:neuraminidase-like domain-containing protein [Pseudomonas laurylsulfatiphila]|uniref:Tc toxin subunit A-related protein n=1 Tax=Pseudomonas laurylsulfatiphila TaxID=2011015 RepID=UPI003D138BB6
MNKPVIGALAERRRSALVDYYRSHVAPSQDQGREQPFNLTTIDDVQQYLLMDTQMTAKVDTSPLAEAIACLQRYLGRIYSKMEPGYSDRFSADELEYWHKRLCNISDWAGYQMLEDYPENYISPGLRLKKTKSFIDLENNLSQARISDASVQAALYEHLGKFEKICNLKLISAYIDSTDKPLTKPQEPTFTNTHYYFIGRQTEQPYSYYWRKVQVHINEKNKDQDYLNPAGWSEWEELLLPAGLEVLAVRPVVFGGRLSLVYIEGEQAKDEKDKDGIVTKPGAWAVEAKLSWLGLNGIWSTPVSLRKEEFAVLNKEAMRLVAVTVEGPNKDIDDWLAVAFTSLDAAPGVQTWRDDTVPGWLFACVDAYLQPQPVKVATLQSWTGGRFKDQRSLQHKVTRDEYAALNRTLRAPASGGTIEGDLSGTLGVNLNFSSQLDDKGVIQNRLQVQGVCQASRLDFDLKEIVLLSRHQFGDVSAYFEISYYGPSTILLSCYAQLHSKQMRVELLFKDLAMQESVLGGIEPSEFSDNGGGWSRATKDIELSQYQLEQLALRRPDEAFSGAGMSINTNLGLARFNQSVNKLSVNAQPQHLSFGLKLFDGSTQLKAQDFAFDLEHWYASGWLDYTWQGDPKGKTLSVTWGDDSGNRGRDKYDITINQAPTASELPRLDTQVTGAQFLDLRSLKLTNLPWVRLNSPFGPVLKSKVAVSIDELLSWQTQNSLEPKPVASAGSYASEKMDFRSAHGVFYWELFFHLPFLIAHRLCEERNYLESQRWFHYLFDPQNKRDKDLLVEEGHWYCRPLLEPGYAGAEADNLVDPDAMAYACPVIYRKTIFTGYVRCILAHADSLYRRLTRDDLVAAKLLYERALALLGPKPDVAPMSHWVPKSVAEILNSSGARGLSSFEMFERSFEVNVASLPERVVGTPQLAGLELDEFRPATNEMLLDLWRHIEQCVSNMANNLTIDGKPMLLPLFASPTNPLDLLRAQAGGSSGASRSAGGWLNIPHYRFRTMLASSQNAVQTLMRFGQQVLQFMEQRDRGQLEELQQSHLIELSAFAREIQQATIEQLRVQKDGLGKSRAVLEQREAFYKEQQASGLKAIEISADAMGGVSRLQTTAAFIPEVTAGIARTAVRIGGLVGAVVPLPVTISGSLSGDSGASLASTASTLTGSGGVSSAVSDTMRLLAYYNRRTEEWNFQQRQAAAEIDVIDEQILAQEHAIVAAEASLRQTKKSAEQAQAIYSFHKTRATNVELYRWLLSQMATHYYQAHDAVVGLCLSAQASWQYEMGDYDTTFVRPNVWMDNYHGLMAGESMALDLLRMESAFLHRHERRLELVKTVSLRQLFDANNEEDPSKEDWTAMLRKFKDEGSLDFELSQQLFDRDYPGHYCRQITTVDVTLPVVLGPYQDVRLILTQVSSTTAVKPVVSSLDYLYAPDASRTPADIKLNLRNSQQIAVSTGIDDSGQHMMNFGDERYQPFEGTGAVSKWKLEFPLGKDDEQAANDSLTDIIVRIRYLAFMGNITYRDAVLAKLNPVPET